MEPVFQSSHGVISLIPSLPAGWTGGILPGSHPYSYVGPLGAATVQKFDDKRFSICYLVSEFLQKIKLFWKEESLLRLQYVLDGKLQYREPKGKLIKLKPGQVNAVWSPGRATTADLKEGRLEILQIAFRPEVVQELLPDFPDDVRLPAESSRQWIGQDRQKDIYELLNVSYTDDARRFFYSIKVREHLLRFLLPIPGQDLSSYPEEIIERIFRVDREILKDLTKHHNSKDLADLVKLPEARLVTLFKEIIGVSMFDRYKEAKLEKAKRYLVETDIPIKALSKMVGYESYTGFLDAFKEKFKISAYRYRKNYRPFD
jgi:AraC-like DNA-binding protein